MKKFIVILFLGLHFSANGQTDSVEADKVFVDVFHNSKTKKSKRLYYVDSCITWKFLLEEAFANSLEFYGIDTNRNKVVVKLTKAERDYILKEALRVRSKIWRENILLFSTRIKADSAGQTHEHFAKLNHEFTDRNMNNYLNVIYISYPIFIRENQLCLIYVDSRCGYDCGYNLGMFLKKVNNKWTPISNITGGEY